MIVGDDDEKRVQDARNSAHSLTDGGRRVSTDDSRIKVQAARDQLALSVGKLNSRSTRMADAM